RDRADTPDGVRPAVRPRSADVCGPGRRRRGVRAPARGCGPGNGPARARARAAAPLPAVPARLVCALAARRLCLRPRPCSDPAVARTLRLPAPADDLGGPGALVDELAEQRTPGAAAHRARGARVERAAAARRDAPPQLLVRSEL